MAENSRTEQESVASDDAVQSCCGGYREHRYRCPARVWPATATPEIKRLAIRGDCIGPAHAQIEDLAHGLDYQQRKKLTEILAQVWDDGFEYGQQVQAGDPAALCSEMPFEHDEQTFGPPKITLAEDLTPFLDWPLYFPDDSVHCNQFPNCRNRFCTDPMQGQVYVASGRRLTVREFLADIKAHAEDAK